MSDEIKLASDTTEHVNTIEAADWTIEAIHNAWSFTPKAIQIGVFRDSTDQLPSYNHPSNDTELEPWRKLAKDTGVPLEKLLKEFDTVLAKYKPVH